MAFPTTEACILEAERQLGRKLPAALRQRLLVNNGGEMEADNDSWQLHAVWDSSNRKTMGRTANHIVRETQEARKWTTFPAGAIAIAGSGTGDLLVLMPGSDEVWLWSHETGDVEVVKVDFSAE